MAKKNILKKIVGVVLALALCSSVCIMPQATNEFLPDGAQTTLVYEFDFDTAGKKMSVNNAKVGDDVLVCGGAYQYANANKSLTGNGGEALYIYASDDQARNLAFNDTKKWLTLEAGSYYATYDYKVTKPVNSDPNKNLENPKPAIYFIKFVKSSYVHSAEYTSISSDLIGDYNAYNTISTEWQQGGVYFDIDASNPYFGLREATHQAEVILDNIKIYKITGYAQPAVYDFDSHNFYDGWAQTASENTIDGLDGRTKNTNTEFLHGTFTMTGLSGTRSTAGIGGFYNVVNVESGSSRSYFVGGVRVPYNSDSYPGLANSGHKNVLRFGWNLNKSNTNLINNMESRIVALNPVSVKEYSIATPNSPLVEAVSWLNSLLSAIKSSSP